MWVKLVGLGPGAEDLITPAAQKTLAAADVIIGYEYYFVFVQQFVHPHAKQIKLPLTQEQKRAQLAFQYAKKGKKVALIGSGDTGVYSMANLLFQEAHKAENLQTPVDIQVIPGISACLAAASRLGAPLADDFCCISLSDKQTPWQDIQKRVNAAAAANFVICIYNPKSKERYWQLNAVQQIMLKHQRPQTPVAVARQVYRAEEDLQLSELGKLNQMQVDMFSIVIIGNSNTYVQQQKMVTKKAQPTSPVESQILPQNIQQQSFNYILKHLQKTAAFSASAQPQNLGTLWPLLRVIHTTGDFGYQNWFKISPQAMQKWNEYLENGGVIITDVEMVKVGIQTKNKAQVVCYLNDPKSAKLAEQHGITRSQAGIRLGITHHPKALFVIGCAPTALIELANAIQFDKLQPTGVVGTVVGFIQVLRAKQKLESCLETLQACTAGNRGGSTIATAIVNAALTYKQAAGWWQQSQQ